MKQRLTCPGSSATIPAHPIVFLLLLSVLCCSRAHSKVIQTRNDLHPQHDLHPKKQSLDKNHLFHKLKNYLDHTAGHNQSVHQTNKDLAHKLNRPQAERNSKAQGRSPFGSDHHRAIVEDFKAKILRYLGLSAPPVASALGRFNASVGRQIREFMRTFHLGNPVVDGQERSNVNKTETFIFHSTGPAAWDTLLRGDIRRPTLALRTLLFNTHFHQPEFPYLDLVMKSAFLRMRISIQKNFLDRDKNVPLKSMTANLYVTRMISDTENTSVESKSVFISSFPVHFQTRSVEIPLNPEHLSHLVDLKDQQIVFIVAIGNDEKDFDNSDEEKDLNSIDSSDSYNLTRRDTGPKTFRIIVSRAVLEVATVTKDLRRSRGKRQTKEPSCQDNLCCRNSIFITFKDIGWDDWVMAPEGYTAYFCKGGCPHRYKSASTFSGIKGLLHLSKPNIVPEPTCAASGYTSITLLHLNEDGDLVSTKYPEMVVTGCRCY